MGPIYEIILNYLKKNIKLKIIKVISTRYNLSLEPKLDPFIPGLVFQGDLFNFNKQDITHFDDSINVSPPTPEELYESKKYENYIFDYKLSNNSILGHQVIGKNYNYNINQNFNYYGNNRAYAIPINVNINQGMNNNNETNNNLNFDNYQTKERGGNLF